MLGAGNLVLLVLVAVSIGGIHFGPSAPKTSVLTRMALADIQGFLWLILVIVLFALASSVWDWRYKLLSGLTWGVAYCVNRNNDGLVQSAKQYWEKPLAPVGYRQILFLRGLIVVMTGELVVLVVHTGGWAVSPYMQYGVTVFLLSMLLTDILRGRVSLAIAGIAWISAVIAWGRLDAYRYEVSNSTFAGLTVVNFIIQLIVVAMASETFEIGGLVKRRRGSGGTPG